MQTIANVSGPAGLPRGVLLMLNTLRVWMSSCLLDKSPPVHTLFQQDHAQLKFSLSFFTPLGNRGNISCSLTSSWTSLPFS